MQLSGVKSSALSIAIFKNLVFAQGFKMELIYLLPPQPQPFPLQ